MSEEITICLRQEDSVQVDQNGVFTSTLATPVELNPGDEVSIKSVFLDTTDVIDIPAGGTDVSLSGMKYFVNYNINQEYKYRVGNAIVPAGGEAPLQTSNGAVVVGENKGGDNTKYWLADALTSTAHNPYYLLNVNAIPLTKGRGGKKYGGDIIVEYTDSADLTKPFGSSTTIHIAKYQEDRYQNHNPIPIPQQARRANPTDFYVIKCADVGGQPQIRVSKQTDLALLSIKEITFSQTPGTVQPITPVGGTTEINPQIFTWTATVPEGQYTPHEIAAYLTDALTPVELLGATSEDYDKADGANWDPSAMKWPANTPFLTTVLQNEYELSQLNDADNTHQQVFINGALQDLEGNLLTNAGTVARAYRIDAMKAEYNPAVSPSVLPIDRWIGTNEISLSFDENENKLKWDILHFPIYTNSTVTDAGVTNADAKPGLQYNELQQLVPANNSPSGIAKAYGGIAFTAMEPSTFWDTQLGFNNNTINVVPNSAKCNWDNTGVPTENNSFTLQNCISGQTFTEGAATLATPVRTSSNLQYTGGKPGLFASPVELGFVSGGGVGGQVTTPDVVAIFANKVYNDQIQSVGYFLVDIDNNFPMDFVSENTRSQLSANTTNGRDTMSVVSRYYTANNFVTDQGSGSIVYTHSGAPKKLTELSVRIKNPDGSFVGDTILGNKNTVFLTISKSGQPKTGGAPPVIIDEIEEVADGVVPTPTKKE